MIPAKLTLSNFMSFQTPQTLDFTQFEIACLTGDNGVGKSTILEAITWALWGKARGEKLTDEIIHQGTQGMWVEFIFNKDGKIFKVLRKREKKGKVGKTTLYFGLYEKAKDSWQNLTQEEIAKTQDKISHTLRLPYEIFTNSAYLRQGHADEFTIKTAADRKQILSDILGLDIFAKLEEKAKEKNKIITKQNEEILGHLENLKEQILEKEDFAKELSQIIKEKDHIQTDLKNLEIKLETKRKEKNQLQILEEKLFRLKQDFERLCQEFNSKISEKNELAKEIEQTQILLKNKNKIIVAFNQLEKDIIEEQKIDKKYRQYIPIKEKVIKLQTLEERLKEEILKIKGRAVCPTCKRPFTKDQQTQAIKHINEEFNKKYGHTILTCNKQLATIDYDEKKHSALRIKISESQKLIEEKRQLDLALNNLNHFTKRNEVLKQELVKQKKEIIKIKEIGISTKKDFEKLKVKVGDFDILEIKVSTSRDNLNEKSSQLGGLREKLNQIKSFESKIALLEKQKLILDKQNNMYETLAFLFSKNGVPTLVIEDTLPALEEEANIILKKVSSNDMRVEFKLERPKKTGNEMIETLDILIYDTLGCRPYELFSGGEAFRINFAIRIALSKLLAKKASAQVRFLAIDEGFGNLDSAGREDIISAINSIKDDFEKILVVTHLEELKNAFQTQIQVYKEEDGSKIKIME